MRVEFRRKGWYLCDWADRPDGEYHEFHGNQDFALQWLRQFRSDDLALHKLRVLCLQAFMKDYSDDEVLRQVSWWLSCGRVKARRPVIRIAPGTSGRKPVTESPAFPVEQRTSASPAAPRPTPDPPLFPSDVHPEAIAEGQRKAALLGLAFCEECLKG